MKPVERGEILGLAEYEAIRERFRARVIEDKRVRRVAVGPKASAVFENRDTVLLQIQEMLRTERITRPAAVQHEIDTYNELVPGADELSCTLMIEIADKAERDEFLVAAAGLERHIAFVAAGERVAGRSIDRSTDPDRTTAVHYVKFQLPAELAKELRRAVAAGGGMLLELSIDHAAYKATAALTMPTVRALAEDLEA